MHSLETVAFVGDTAKFPTKIIMPFLFLLSRSVLRVKLSVYAVFTMLHTASL